MTKALLCVLSQIFQFLLFLLLLSLTSFHKYFVRFVHCSNHLKYTIIIFCIYCIKCILSHQIMSLKQIPLFLKHCLFSIFYFHFLLYFFHHIFQLFVTPWHVFLLRVFLFSYSITYLLINIASFRFLLNLLRSKFVPYVIFTVFPKNLNIL